MKKSQKLAQRRARHQRAVMNRLEKKQKLLLSEAEEEDVPEDEDTLEESDVDDEDTEKSLDGLTEKDIYGDAPMNPMSMAVGPTSFEELDQQRFERERADKLGQTAYQVRYLVDNILQDDNMGVKEKAAAIAAVGDGFSSRSDEILSASNASDLENIGKAEAEETDLDILSLQAIQAYDKRHAGMLDLLKAVLNSGARNSLPDSAFAFVTTRDGKKVRKYPVHDASHARNALSRASAEMKSGGENASDARAAMPKIRAACKKFGIEMSMHKEHEGILIEKDASGAWRWVGWASNNFLDWQGEIVSKEAHEEYVQWWEKNREVSPVFATWHTPGTTRKDPVDFMTFEKGFLIMSGPLQETEASALLKMRKSIDLGMSIGGFALERDSSDPRIITKYRLFEVSDLPLENAANPFTNVETIVKEVGMDKKAFLAQYLGSEEKAEELLKRAGLAQKTLNDAGIESKEKKEATPGAPAAPAAPAAPNAPAVTPVVPAAPVAPVAPEMKAIVEQVIKELDIPALNDFVAEAQEAIEKVPLLEALVKNLQTGKNEELAKLLTPPAARFAWSKEKRASASDSNKLQKDDKLADAAPGVPDNYWLSHATGTTPISSSEVPA